MYVYMETGINSDLFNNRGEIAAKDIANGSADPVNHERLMREKRQLRVIFLDKNLGTKDIPASLFEDDLPDRIVPVK